MLNSHWKRITFLNFLVIPIIKDRTFKMAVETVINNIMMPIARK